MSRVPFRRPLIRKLASTPANDGEPLKNPEDISAAVIQLARKSGQLNLQGRGLTEISPMICNLNFLTEQEIRAIDVSLERSATEAWWDQQPLSKLFLASNQLITLPAEIGQLEHLTVLELQDNVIMTLPKQMEALSNLVRLNLSRNKMTELPDCICHFKDLKVLQLQHNSIVSVSDNVNGLISLDELDLSHNKLKGLPESFTFLSKTKRIDLSNNKIESLPPDMDSLIQLRCLDVSNNMLTELPEGLGRCSHLEQLIIRQNKLTSLPQFVRENHLKELCASFNAIEEFTPEHCETFVVLKILDLRGNKLQSVPEAITNIQGLERLDLSNNDLRSLPYSIGALNHMNSLLVEGNPLRSIRQDILRRGTVHLMKYLRDRLQETPMQDKLRASLGGDGEDLLDSVDRFTLKSSRTLDFSNKGLNSLDDKVVDLACEDKVNQLVMSKNSFLVVPDTLERLVDQLLEVDFSFNKLTKVPEFLGKAQYLQYLNLQSNQLQDLPAELGSLKLIRELNISQNRFSKLPDCIYSWNQFEVLIASENLIGTIDVHKLSQLEQLTTLDLRNNSIALIPPELGNLRQLKSLQLEGNLFRNPRPAVLAKGTQHLLAYLRDRIPC
ncbi:leucine-rich repeat-containing protein 40-like isoform X1 [Varroa jacobsoni]|uniref:leucine-rich repeat-containing protein 40-like isoform X1 n=1 Tax=Varroa jacobsoni TaxID=62625 RepID=UPI000BF35419|nr:leucine-rich repeat-containing protein 40-like isoform X1 [Varroa jacobsoni]XP_022700520.1 leucine-rich repeat-containing protein 40-like isoform X1 [Varroa jacobsoni]XP_022700521.1 leucine-rich repeat-containing protein 40-like isoform X1 [Varroa jacobsoni]